MKQKGAVSLVGVNKYYGSNHVVKDLDFEIRGGEFLSLLGPSGCGKSTILRMIAGFETIDSGDILLDGRSIIRQEPYRRGLNTIFQNYALFPHMNVYDNVAYGLRARHCKKSEIRERVEEMLELVKLTGFEDRYPTQMSGGQRQRVAIARAAVNRPPVLLLDEPLTALDMKLRKEMRFELRHLQQTLGITFVYVTHDQEEALVMSDRIAVMNNGRIEQAAVPRRIYNEPDTCFAAEFIGETNAMDALVVGTDGDVLTLNSECGAMVGVGGEHVFGELVHVSVRPDRLLWSAEPVDGFSLAATVTDIVFTGPIVKALLQAGNGQTLTINRLAGEDLPQIGRQVWLWWQPQDAVLIHTVGHDIFRALETIDLGAWVNRRE